MILFADTTPPPDAAALKDMYARLPQEGMVHSALMLDERFEMAEAFDPSWSCAAVTWSVGGSETYDFVDGRRATLGPVGAMSIAAGARYAYTASATRPFRSNMIVFPHWVSGTPTDAGNTISLGTRRFHPDGHLAARMHRIARLCREIAPPELLAEQVALLYAALLDAQDRAGNRPVALGNVRRSTGAELGRRVDRARTLMLERYREPRLSLDDIATASCLSKYHLVRVFRTCCGVTPMQFLAGIRLDAATSLLRHTDRSIAEIATAVGYRDRSAFGRAYRRRFGSAPSAMRRCRDC